METVKGSQTPTKFLYLDTDKDPSRGNEAIELYEKSGRIAEPWQKEMLRHMLAYDAKTELWVHSTFAFEVPRRNGKNEILVMRELYGLFNAQRGMHTAHRTNTSTEAFERLYDVLITAGFSEGTGRKSKRSMEDEPDFRALRQKGMERIIMSKKWGGGYVNFRTRSAGGGLGESYDYLITDEAQDLTDDQNGTLQYMISASPNPQKILNGTPPTTISVGTVFPKLRKKALLGETMDTAWAEWSVDRMTDVNDIEAWYATNPALGYHLTERAVRAEINGDDIDFNIQRLGLWIEYNQKSAISEADWDILQDEELPNVVGKLFVGIKYGKDTGNVAMSIAARTDDDRIFIEAIDCRNVRFGNDWILGFLGKADVEKTVIDGASGQAILAESMKALKLKKPVLPTVKEIIQANAIFESGVQSMNLCHAGQPSLKTSATNCDKRSIGANGGFGYKSIRDDVDVCLLDSAILAYWLCAKTKPKKKAQQISY